MYKYITLDNGIRLGLFEMPEVRSVALKAMLPGGPVVEDELHAGASHFIEHIVLDGTKSYHSKYDFAKNLEELGISYNGYTATQEISFEFDVPYTNIEKAIDILEEVLFYPLFSNEIIEKEREVILSEMQDRENSPDFLFYYISQEKRFKDKQHPLSQKVIGKEATVRALTKPMLWDLYEKLFCPENILIGLVGNFNADEIIAYMNARIGTFKRGEKLTEKVFSNADLSSSLIYTEEHAKFTNVYTAITSPGYPLQMKPNEEQGLHLFSAILGGARTSRLFQEVREEEGLVYDISTSSTNAKGVGEFMISFEADSSKLDRILTIVYKNIEKALKEGFTEEEVRHMKQYMVNRAFTSFSSPWRINNWILDYLFDEEKVLMPEDLISIIQAVTMDDVRQAVQDNLQLNALNLVMVGKLEGYKPKEILSV